MKTAPLPLLLLALATAAHAQQVAHSQLRLDENAVRQQLIQNDPPTYPAIAKAARVEGSVVIQITIDAKGNVSKETARSGPPMLRQAAMDAVRTWRFSPFLVDGKPQTVISRLTVPFSLAPLKEAPTADQQKAAQALFPLSDQCRKALASRNAEASLNLCKQAVDLSEKAGDLTSSDQLMKMNVLEYYGHALLIAGKPNEALTQENAAIEEAKKCLTDTDEEYGIPFFWKAKAEETLQPEQANQDYQTAEASLRKALQHLPDMKNMYGNYLTTILKQHAALMETMGKPQEAISLRNEAANLNEP